MTDYHPSNLIRLKAKGNKWYVQVTKPEVLQTPTSKQERRSTGTTDRKIAQQRQHTKTQEIYRKFDQQLGVDRTTPLLKVHSIDSHPDPLFMYRSWPAFNPDDPAKRILVLRQAEPELPNTRRRLHRARTHSPAGARKDKEEDHETKALAAR